MIHNIKSRWKQAPVAPRWIAWYSRGVRERAAT